MIQLLFLVIFAEGAVALLLLVKIGPLRELAMRMVDQLKTGKGPATVKTLACTMSVLLLSSVASIAKIQNRGAKLGTVTPMDQVLWRTHLLEASLIGFTLFLAFVIDRLHHYLTKLITLRKTISTSRDEVERLKKDHLHTQDKEEKHSKEVKNLQDEVSTLNERLQKLTSELKKQEKRAVDAEAHVASLQNQSEELLLEYDRLLEDNQILQSQAMALRG
ncbi:B-cell receptor-associated protein 31-like [Iris pallida]|uniref:Endoplasmic reticulum transmembrane protein n=1 Tax=Iris pallida TaxID=29817 RepID=A0AAX6FH98_IRIPA|nr:B-cell receptor-associated protein 31-like [Iris pallida]KAJ6815579.1 B-cell receptor-associated protein 31-like [Iris pallida]